MYRADISSESMTSRPGSVNQGVNLRSMTFRSESMRGAPTDGAGPGQVDYRLARIAVVSEFNKGRLSRRDVCVAHPELLRAANYVGQNKHEPCPICDSPALRLISYVFGARLPAHG